jgi:hypothetical protein
MWTRCKHGRDFDPLRDYCPECYVEALFAPSEPPARSADDLGARLAAATAECARLRADLAAAHAREAQLVGEVWQRKAAWALAASERDELTASAEDLRAALAAAARERAAVAERALCLRAAVSVAASWLASGGPADVAQRALRAAYDADTAARDGGTGA